MLPEVDTNLLLSVSSAVSKDLLSPGVSSCTASPSSSRSRHPSEKQSCHV